MYDEDMSDAESSRGDKPLPDAGGSTPSGGGALVGTWGDGAAAEGTELAEWERCVQARLGRPSHGRGLPAKAQALRGRLVCRLLTPSRPGSAQPPLSGARASAPPPSLPCRAQQLTGRAGRSVYPTLRPKVWVQESCTRRFWCSGRPCPTPRAAACAPRARRAHARGPAQASRRVDGFGSMLQVRGSHLR